MTNEKSCGAVIFRKVQDHYQFVVVQQKHGLHFGFPKGHVEVNESESMTAIREVKEETGLDIEILSEFKEKTSYFPKQGVSKEVVYFLARAITFELTHQESEISNAQWVDAANVLSRLTYTSDQEVFIRLLQKANISW